MPRFAKRNTSSEEGRRKWVRLPHRHLIFQCYKNLRDLRLNFYMQFLELAKGILFDKFIIYIFISL